MGVPFLTAKELEARSTEKEALGRQDDWGNLSANNSEQVGQESTGTIREYTDERSGSMEQQETRFTESRILIRQLAVTIRVLRDLQAFWHNGALPDGDNDEDAVHLIEEELQNQLVIIRAARRNASAETGNNAIQNLEQSNAYNLENVLALIESEAVRQLLAEAFPSVPSHPS